MCFHLNTHVEEETHLKHLEKATKKTNFNHEKSSIFSQTNDCKEYMRGNILSYKKANALSEFHTSSKVLCTNYYVSLNNAFEHFKVKRSMYI